MATFNKIYRFRSACVRDLAWAIASSPLIENYRNRSELFFSARKCEKEYDGFSEELKFLDKNPKPLLDFLESKKSRLIGKLFEYYVEFWLRNSPRYELYASGLQVANNRRTVGEFDFIYYDKRESVYTHLEVAGKFYIWRGNSFDYSDFVAPNPTDNLAKKLKAIVSKQILLSETEEGKAALHELGIERVVPRVCFKGYIYYPYGKAAGLPVFPREHFRGTWIASDKINELKGKRWTIVPMENWISPLFDVQNFCTFSQLKEKISEYFNATEYPLLIAELEKENESYYEKRRIFVIRDKSYLYNNNDALADKR